MSRYTMYDSARRLYELALWYVDTFPYGELDGDEEVIVKVAKEIKEMAASLDFQLVIPDIRPLRDMVVDYRNALIDHERGPNPQLIDLMIGTAEREFGIEPTIVTLKNRKVPA